MLSIIVVFVVNLIILLPYSSAQSYSVGSQILQSTVDHCGKTSLRGGNIIGGIVAGDGEFPWLVSLQHKLSLNSSYKHFCGASIITDRWILTAAHCVQKFTEKPNEIPVIALVGTNNLSEQPQQVTGQQYLLESIVIPENYNNLTFNHDIALVRTAHPIKFIKTASNYKVNAICLPPWNEKSLQRTPYPPSSSVVAGWGAINERTQAVQQKMLKVTVETVPKESCSETYKQHHHMQLTDEMICYGRNQKDACQGDSGGSLQTIVGGRSYQIGVVSFGAGCGSYPGVYSEVLKYRKFIEDHIY